MVLIEALVLNGHSRVQQVLGHFLDLHPNPVLLGIEVLHLDVLTIRRIGILIVHGRGQVGVIFIQLQVCLRQNDIFDVGRGHAGQHCHRNDENEHDGHYDLKSATMLFTLALCFHVSSFSIVFQFDTSDVHR